MEEEKGIQKYKSASHILEIIHNLKSIKYYGNYFVETQPYSIFSIVLRKVLPKIDWVYTEFITSNLIVMNDNGKTVELIKEKWEYETTFELFDLRKKLGLLDKKQLMMVNDMVDSIILGEPIDYELKEETE